LSCIPTLCAESPARAVAREWQRCRRQSDHAFKARQQKRVGVSRTNTQLHNLPEKEKAASRAKTASDLGHPTFRHPHGETIKF
jgi:hypothetical protein